MYHKQRIHKDKMSKCRVCMARITKMDPDFAARVSKLAAMEDKLRKRN
jgi:hypothetical protein